VESRRRFQLREIEASLRSMSEIGTNQKSQHQRKQGKISLSLAHINSSHIFMWMISQLDLFRFFKGFLVALTDDLR
jgi:hypothetical protein